MNLPQTIESIVQPAESKIILLILDGLGDIKAASTNWRTPLEAANTPNLDALAKESVTGRGIPVAPGITPGSGPGHLALFGYDPLTNLIGRGVLEAVGLGMEIRDGDLAVRANFATLNEKGVVQDRRAGRIPTELNQELVGRLRDSIKEIDGVPVEFASGLQHRFAMIFRGSDAGETLGDNLHDTDPGRVGERLVILDPDDAPSKRSAELINTFMARGFPLLDDQDAANGFLLRGFSGRPGIKTLQQRFGLISACVAVYPMYRGLASLAGMTLLDTGKSVKEEFATVKVHWDDHDYFFIHVKGTDASGEDGNFDAKVSYIEEVDQALPDLLGLQPDVIAVTGDHSTPVPMSGHSWHPVPVLINSSQCGRDPVEVFTEDACNVGGLGIFEMKHLMTLLLANAGRLGKYGA